MSGVEMQKARQLILLAGRVEVVGYENPIILEEFLLHEEKPNHLLPEESRPSRWPPKTA